MKDSIALILFILIFFGMGSILVACTPIDESVYECTITYTVDGNVITEKIENVVLPDVDTPAYSCGDGKINLVGFGPGNYQILYSNIITTNQKVTVQDFDYKLIRKYKASRWDGHELKPRNKKK